jgi:hypothetical protein
MMMQPNKATSFLVIDDTRRFCFFFRWVLVAAGFSDEGIYNKRRANGSERVY